MNLMGNGKRDSTLYKYYGDNVKGIDELRKRKKYCDRRDIEFQLLGWMLFIGCAVCFIASGLKNQDFWSFFGSFLFLVACVFFVIPLVQKYQLLKQFQKVKTTSTSLD